MASTNKSCKRGCCIYYSDVELCKNCGESWCNAQSVVCDVCKCNVCTKCPACLIFHLDTHTSEFDREIADIIKGNPKRVASISAKTKGITDEFIAKRLNLS